VSLPIKEGSHRRTAVSHKPSAKRERGAKKAALQNRAAASPQTPRRRRQSPDGRIRPPFRRHRVASERRGADQEAQARRRGRGGRGGCAEARDAEHGGAGRGRRGAVGAERGRGGAVGGARAKPRPRRRRGADGAGHPGGAARVLGGRAG
jgi:hypothetical protein